MRRHRARCAWVELPYLGTFYLTSKQLQKQIQQAVFRSSQADVVMKEVSVPVQPLWSTMIHGNMDQLP